MIKKPLVVISGPTAVGKTKISIALAKALDAEIISADSMQVYRHMDIGSAKITAEEMDHIPHHLIDVIDPAENFNVYTFQKMAQKAMEEIYQRNKLPIIVGGTGFYIQALTRDIAFSKEHTDLSYRKSLESMAKQDDGQLLYEMLKEQDPSSAKQIHPNNTKRIIRALEYMHITGKPISEHNKEQRLKKTPYNLYYYVLCMERMKMYQRIEKRVDDMINHGLVEEVTALKAHGITRDMCSAQGLGYKEIFAYLDGECSLEDAIKDIKKNTRHFAKRQMTWFRREDDVIFLNKDELSDQQIIELIKEQVQHGTNV